jgi:hypothetical protein
MSWPPQRPNCWTRRWTSSTQVDRMGPMPLRSFA